VNERTTQKLIRHGGLILFILSIAALCSTLDRFVLSILVQPIKADLGFTDVQMGTLQGIAFAAFYAIFALPIAWFADRSDRALLIAIGLLTWSVATSVSGLATGYTFFLIARMMVGVGEAALNPAAYSLLSDIFDRSRLARAIGVFQAALAAGSGLSVLLGGALLSLFGTMAAQGGAPFALAPWRLTMMTLALPGLLLAIGMILFFRDPARHIRKGAASPPMAAAFRALLANRAMVLKVIIGHSFTAVAGYGVLTWFPTHLIRSFQLTPAFVGLASGLTTAIFGIAGPLIAGLISDRLYPRFGRRAPMVTLMFAMMIGFFMVPAGLVQSWQVALGLFAISYLAQATAPALTATILQLNTPTPVRARISAIWVCIFNLTGYGLGPFVVAWLVEHLFRDPASVGRAISLNYGVTQGMAVLLIGWALCGAGRADEEVD
jgi:MFS family permease